MWHFPTFLQHHLLFTLPNLGCRLTESNNKIADQKYPISFGYCTQLPKYLVGCIIQKRNYSTKYLLYGNYLFATVWADLWRWNVDRLLLSYVNHIYDLIRPKQLSNLLLWYHIRPLQKIKKFQSYIWKLYMYVLMCT